MEKNETKTAATVAKEETKKDVYSVNLKEEASKETVADDNVQPDEKPDASLQEAREPLTMQEVSEDDMDDFFDTDASEITSEELVDEYVGDENLYAPSLDNEKVVNREYKATGRFIKNPRKRKDNDLKNIITKNVCWIPNPNNPETKIMVDDMSAWNRNNILTNAFFELYRSGSLTLKTLAQENFSRKTYHWSLYKVENDIQQPELNGEIKVFRFATQVDKIINEAVKEDKNDGIVAKLYSDVLKGHKFILNINEQEVDKRNSDEKMTITNYTTSRFADVSTPLQFPKNEEKGIEGVREDWFESNEGKKEMFQYLIKNSPVLEDYEAKHWDAETEQLVIESIKNTINNYQLFDKIYTKTYGKSYYKGKSAADIEADKLKSDPNYIDSSDGIEEFPEAGGESPNAVKANPANPGVDVEDIKSVDLDD